MDGRNRGGQNNSLRRKRENQGFVVAVIEGSAVKEGAILERFYCIIIFCFQKHKRLKTLAEDLVLR